MKVVCLNWNNYLGRGDEYVSKLRNMVARHLTIPYEFIVVTEADLPTGKEGWWNKLSLLRMYGDVGTVLYLDLDVVISGNIDHLITLARTNRSKLWMRDDFSYSIVEPRIDDPETIKLLGGRGCCNSSVIIYHSKLNLSGVTPQMLAEMHGDQNVLTHLFWPHCIGLLPNDSIKSYKYHWQQDKGYGPITVFHGTPKNHEVNDQWVLDSWR